MDVCSQCWSSYGTFIAGMATTGIIGLMWEEMKFRKADLERTRTQWKSPPFVEVRRHPDVMDNNSIPGGP